MFKTGKPAWPLIWLGFVLLAAIVSVSVGAKAQWQSPPASAIRAAAPDQSRLALYLEIDHPVGVMLVLLRLDPEVNQWTGLWVSAAELYGEFSRQVAAAGGPNAWILGQKPKIDNALKAKFPAGGIAAALDPGPVATSNPPTPEGVAAELARFQLAIGADGLMRLVPR